MRRVLTVLVLASFAAGPALRISCLAACAAAQRAASPVSCHSNESGGPAVAADHGCPTDGLAFAPAAKRASAAAPIAVSAILPIAQRGDSPDVADAPAPGVHLAAPSPPVTHFLIPLRV